MMFREARKGQFEWRNTIAPLLGDWVVLLAMKDRRAPLPVSSALWKGLPRRDFSNGLDELAIHCVSLSVPGGRAAEDSDHCSHARARDIVKRGMVAAEDRPQIENAQICQ